MWIFGFHRKIISLFEILSEESITWADVKFLTNEVMTPMGTNYGEQNGEMSFLHINYYEQRAKGGTGLLIVENASVDSPTGF